MFTTAMVSGSIPLVSSYKGYEYERHIQLHVPKKVTLQTLLLPLNHK